jgi:hypothetical protein
MIAAIDGSASMPTTRLVTVMPSCAPESWNEIAALDRREGELGCDEGSARDGEQQRHGEQKHFGHRFTSIP